MATPRTITAAKVRSRLQRTRRNAFRRIPGVASITERRHRAAKRPASWKWGLDRGQPIDRVYLEKFLRQHAADIQGTVLEIGADSYINMFGSGVTKSIVYDVCEGEKVDIVGDLATGVGLDDNMFDCVVIVQTLMLIHDLNGAADTIHRILKPGGVALISVNFIAPNGDDPGHEQWQWNISGKALGQLLSDRFGPDNVEVASYGNYAAASSFLAGLAAEEVRSDLWRRDSGYEILNAARAVKSV